MHCDPKLMHRLKRMQGQMQGVLNMMEQQQSCQDLVTQLKAIRENIDKTMSIVTTTNLQQVLQKKGKDDPAVADALDLIIKSR
jgi:DNA-binding FrmR family transcriptional regulator